MRVPVVLLLLVLLGCSGTTTGAVPEPEAEVTTFADPTPEATGATEAPVAGGGGAVAVELPRLPIGGGGTVFTEPRVPQCLGVNLTGDPLPGVGVVIERFAVPHPFALSDDLCGDAPPCLGGHVLTSDGGTGCEVAVEWTGEEGGSGSLGVELARGRCEDPAACARAAEIVASAVPQGLPLTLQPPEPEPGLTTEPAETEPAETEPAETEPAETEPAETEPGS